MKTIIIVLAMLASLFAWGATAFCDGFDAGYKAGYCHRKNYCLEPLSPLCPLPRLGEDTWISGYNRGFLIGLAKQQ